MNERKVLWTLLKFPLCKSVKKAWQAAVNSPIDADCTEIEDAGCTHHHIQSDEDVTVDLAKAPLSHYLEEKNTNSIELQQQAT